MVELSHDQMAVQAYGGSPLTAVHNKKNLYDFLGLKFETADAPSFEGNQSCDPQAGSLR